MQNKAVTSHLQIKKPVRLVTLQVIKKMEFYFILLIEFLTVSCLVFNCMETEAGYHTSPTLMRQEYVHEPSAHFNNFMSFIG